MGCVASIVAQKFPAPYYSRDAWWLAEHEMASASLSIGENRTALLLNYTWEHITDKIKLETHQGEP